MKRLWTSKMFWVQLKVCVSWGTEENCVMAGCYTHTSVSLLLKTKIQITERMGSMNLNRMFRYSQRFKQKNISFSHLNERIFNDILVNKKKFGFILNKLYFFLTLAWYHQGYIFYTFNIHLLPGNVASF